MAKKGVSSKTHTKSQLDAYANQHNPNNEAFKSNKANKKKMKQKRLSITRKPSSEIVGMYCGSIVFKHFLGKKQTSREIFGK